MDASSAADAAQEPSRSLPPAWLGRAAVVVPFVLTLTVLVALGFRLPPPSTSAASPSRSTPPTTSAAVATESPTPAPRPSGSGDEVIDLLLPSGLRLESQSFTMHTSGGDDDSCRRRCDGGTGFIVIGDVANVVTIYDEHLRGRGLARWPSASVGNAVWVGRKGRVTTRISIRVTPQGAKAEVHVDILRDTAPSRADLEYVIEDLLFFDPNFSVVDYPDHHAPVQPSPGAHPTLTLRTKMSVEKSLRAISDALGFGEDYLALGQPCRGTATTAFWLAGNADILLGAQLTREDGVTTVVLTASPRPDAAPPTC